MLAWRETLLDDHPEVVATTWALSFVRVRQANPLAAELLQACAFLAPAAIPEALLVEVLKISLPSANKRQGWGGWFSRFAAGRRKPSKHASHVRSREDVQNAIAILCAYSLLQWENKKQMVEIYQLIQAVIRDMLEERAQDVWIKRIVGAVNQCFPDVHFETWEQYEVYLPQALTCYGRIEQRHLQMRESAALLYRAAWDLADRARYAQAEPLCMPALAIVEQQLGAEHPQLIAKLYSSEQHLETEEETPAGFKPSRPDLCSILLDIATCIRSCGRQHRPLPDLARSECAEDPKPGHLSDA